jgi:hypothetical protein
MFSIDQRQTNALEEIARALTLIATAIADKPKDIKEEALNETLSYFEKRLFKLENKFRVYE